MHLNIGWQKDRPWLQLIWWNRHKGLKFHRWRGGFSEILVWSICIWRLEIRKWKTTDRYPAR